jgi:hypothetical protein
MNETTPPLNPLEQTIVNAARFQLNELRVHLLLPSGRARTERLSSAFWMLSGFTMLAHTPRSGMGPRAIGELIATEAAATEAIAAAKLRGVVRSSL